MLARDQRRVCVVEALEARRLLSGTIYVVNSLVDAVAMDGVVTLREAVQAANGDAAVNEAGAGSASDTDVITFDAGLFAGGAGKIRLGGTELGITGKLEVRGPGAEVLTIDGGYVPKSVSASRVFSIKESTAVVSLSGVKITGGYGNGAGVCNAGTLTLTNLAVSGNSGSGIYNANAATLTMKNVTVSGNTSTSYGGGVYNCGACTMSNVAIAGNSASGWGGGGVYNTGTLAMSNVTVSGNSASRTEGTGGHGGGVYNATAGAMTLANTIVAGNSALDVADLLGRLAAGSDYNLIGVLDPARVVSAGLHTISGTVAVPLDAGIGSLTNVNGRLVMPVFTGSPAINAGSNALAVDGEGMPLASDQAGNARIGGGVVDIGAVEYQQGAPQVLLIRGTAGDDEIAVTSVGGKLIYQVNDDPPVSIRRDMVTGIRIDARGGNDDLFLDFDLMDDDLVVQTNPANRERLLQTVNSAIKSARSTTPTWAGHGITSSMAASDPLGIRGVGVMVNSQAKLSIPYPLPLAIQIKPTGEVLGFAPSNRVYSPASGQGPNTAKSYTLEFSDQNYANADMGYIPSLSLRVTDNGDGTAHITVVGRSSSRHFDLVDANMYQILVADFETPGMVYTLPATSIVKYGTFVGQSVDMNSILVKYTLNGDFDLNGKVDFDDYFQINRGFLSGGKKTGYYWGDANLDGKINFDDYWLMNRVYFGQSAAAPAAEAARPTGRTDLTGRHSTLGRKVTDGRRE